MAKRVFRIHPNDNIAVIIGDRLCHGETISLDFVESIVAKDDIPFGHKLALRPIASGENIYKYGFPIGCATRDIEAGEWVHTHNVATALSGEIRYSYHKADALVRARECGSFMGYLRKNGEVGIRNELWILPMVSCVNHTGKIIADAFLRLHPEASGALHALEQPFGCSQLGEDHVATVRLLGNIARHPNAAGVVLLSLGCENNVMGDFLDALGDYDRERILPLITQDYEDEVARGVELLESLYALSKQDQRTPQPLSKLRVGFKCGASDGLSGVTANPLAGRACERLVAAGASAVMTEVPEMFGAEQILMNHARDVRVFDGLVKLINDFKRYYAGHNQPIYENPSPGNKAGGITTLEEKSLGCIQKGGFCEVADILDYAGRVRVPGLTLLSAPGNDPVSITALAASGCQLLVFTTGRGNPLGSIVPTLKLASNTPMATRKHAWIDIDAGVLLENADMDALSMQTYQMILATANGEYVTKSELSGYKEIGIFKNGVTL